MKFKLLLIILYVCSVECQMRGGRDAGEGEAPHHALVEIGRVRDGAYREVRMTFCGGILLNKRWVLTAASCVRGGDAHDRLWKSEVTQVTVGTRYRGNYPNKDGDRQTREVSKIFLHENFWPNMSEDDVALLLMVREVKYNGQTRPALLAHRDKEAEKGWKCRISGFGASDFDPSGKNIYPATLKVATDLKVVKDKHCEAGFGVKSLGNRFCYASTNERETQSCGKGDSGGAVVCDEHRATGQVVHGVMSCEGGDCHGTKKSPCVAARVSRHVDWIDQVIRSETPSMTVRQQGADANVGDAPHHVAMVKHSSRSVVLATCQGAIVGERWLLTAASCVGRNNDKGEFISVKTGISRNRVEGGKSHEWYQHPMYSEEEVLDENNVALVRLNKKITGDDVEPIGLIAADRSENCRVSSFEGDVEEDLQVRKVEVIEDRKCRSPALKPAAMGRMQGRHVCAQQEKGRASISVGEGSALVCEDSTGVKGVFGVASFGGEWERVGGGAGPKVFTKINGSNLKWIRQKMATVERNEEL